MRDILHTRDPVLVSFVASLLGEAGIRFHVADVNISIVEGSIGAFPRRIQVEDARLGEAVRLLKDAGLEGELLPGVSK